MLEVALDKIVALRPKRDELRLLEGIGFELRRGASLGIVGESGSGKSLLALAIIGLLPEGVVARGSVRLDGRDLTPLPERELEAIRGARIGMIFQEPATALDPAMRIGAQIAEGLIRHKGLGHAAAAAEALRLLDRVRIAEAKRRFGAYPHELSGGQRQRVGIAMAIAPGPDLLLADEPTTALDVTVQADILALLAELMRERDMALMLVSHDFGVVAALCDDVLVIYGGTGVETGPTRQVLDAPAHPYTRALLAALPRRDFTAGRARRLRTIPGTVPLPGHWPVGCRFVTRCDHAVTQCRAAEPAWQHIGARETGAREMGVEHAARCIRLDESI